MDALTTLQYRYLLVALGIAVATGAIAYALLGARRSADTDKGELSSDGESLAHIMLLLVAFAVGAGIMLLLPAAVILRYFPHWQVGAMLALALVILAAPLAF